MAGNTPTDDLKGQPLPELFRQLSQETATLVRQEMELAKAEIRETGKKAGMGAGMFGGAGIVGFLALASFTAFLILLLVELGLDAWASALIVTIAYGGAAAVLAMQGRDKLKEATPPAPQTVETVKEDVEWAKHPTKSAGT
ncbi:MAG TPA: phage holin family protein [Actinomycetota bacterium]|nr:phage holin family protein [Actinomycetota bacterium]